MLPDSVIRVEQIVVPETVFYAMWNHSLRLTVYMYCFPCDFCIDLPNLIRTVHDEHHFRRFSLAVSFLLLILRDKINMRIAMAFLYFDEVIAMANLSKQLK